MKHLDKHLVATLALVLSVGSAVAQSSGSGGSSSGGSSTGSGAAGSSSGASGRATTPGSPGGSPALGSTPTGPITPNRSNSEVFPPSRLAPRPGGSIPDPGASTTTPSNQSGTNKDGTAGSNPQDPAAVGSGRVPSPATGGAGGSTKTGKNPATETVSDCMKIWDAGTHMSKADWARTCRRVQGRLDDLKGASERKQ
jgi:hypothetical protein